MVRFYKLLKMKHFKKYGLLSSRPFKLALGKEQFGAGYLDHNYMEKKELSVGFFLTTSFVGFLRGGVQGEGVTGEP